MDDLQNQSFTFADETNQALSIEDLTRSQKSEIYSDHDNEYDSNDNENENHGNNFKQLRYKKLSNELAALRKFRVPLESCVESLLVAQSQNHRLSQRVEQTSVLLDDYMKILRQQEHTRNLMLNEHWHGSVHDSELRQLREEEEIKLRRELEEAKERERVESELAKEKEEREAQLRAAQTASNSSSVRGGSVRGRSGRIMTSTRTSTSSRGISTSLPSYRPQSRIPPPASRISSSTTTNTRGTSTRGRGTTVRSSASSNNLRK